MQYLRLHCNYAQDKSTNNIYTGVCKLRIAKVRKCEVVNCEVECEVGCDWLATRASPRSLPVAMCKLQDPKLRKRYVVNCEVKCEVGCDWLAIPDNQ